MATIKDVAQSAQVSATTVSRVLNRDDNMSVTPEAVSYTHLDVYKRQSGS